MGAGAQPAGCQILDTVQDSANTYNHDIRTRAPPEAGFQLVREDLCVSRLAKRLLPRRLSALVPSVPLCRDILATNMEYLLTA